MTPTSGLDLLRALGSGVVPGREAQSSAAPGGIDFAGLLDTARRGQLNTGREVSLEPGLGLELSSEQMDRLSRAVDRAESSGAGRALVLLDGKALTVDVDGRRVIASQSLGDERALTDIDAVVPAPGEGEKDDENEIVGPPSGWPARDVLRALGLD